MEGAERNKILSTSHQGHFPIKQMFSDFATTLKVFYCFKRYPIQKLYAKYFVYLNDLVLFNDIFHYQETFEQIAFMLLRSPIATRIPKNGMFFNKIAGYLDHVVCLGLFHLVSHTTNFFSALKTFNKLCGALLAARHTKESQIICHNFRKSSISTNSALEERLGRFF